MQFPVHRKKILSQLADGKVHSGADLSKDLGLSRTTIWQQLNHLKQSGVALSAVTGKGYRLKTPLELLDKQAILAKLSATAFEHINALHLHDKLVSTNSFLFEQDAETGAEICLTEYQSAGKGRRGRQWVSPFGSNIYLSILWQYQQGPAAVSGLSLAVGVAVVRALTAAGVEAIGLKWPNDIYWQQKKLGGILVEVRGNNEGPCTVVVGIGLNLMLSGNDALNIAQPWVDLKTIKQGICPGRNELIAGLINQLITILIDFEQTGFSALVEEWCHYDCMQGQQVALLIGANKVSAEVQGINDQGLILLKLADGETRAYASGEVSFKVQ